jgi:hypothetical protein
MCKKCLREIETNRNGHCAACAATVGKKRPWMPLVMRLNETDSFRWWIEKMRDEGFPQGIDESDERALRRYLHA